MIARLSRNNRSPHPSVSIHKFLIHKPMQRNPKTQFISLTDLTAWISPQRMNAQIAERSRQRHRHTTSPRHSPRSLSGLRSQVRNNWTSDIHVTGQIQSKTDLNTRADDWPVKTFERSFESTSIACVERPTTAPNAAQQQGRACLTTNRGRGGGGGQGRPPRRWLAGFNDPVRRV